MRHRIIIQKINDLSPRRANGGVALDGWLSAAGDKDFHHFLSGIVQSPGARHGLDFFLSGPGRNNDCDSGERRVH
jgi:hypothetical protein